MRRRVRLRLLGVALALYGVIGIAIFIVVAVAVMRPLDRARQLSQSVDTERAALVTTLAQAESTIRQMSLSVGRMDQSLSDATAATDRASTISHGVAASMYQLRDTMSIEIPLIGQPLIGLAPSFDTSGQNLDLLGADVAAIGAALNTNRTDVLSTASNMGALADSVHNLTITVRDGPAIGISTESLDAVRFAVFAVAGWLVLLALGCLAAGAYLIAISRRHPAST
jgi:HAMP domain-containing protein